MLRITKGFSTREAAAAAGISERQARYLMAKGLMAPSIHRGVGHGNRSIWSGEDVHALAALATMRERGLSLQALGKVERVLNSRDGSAFQNIHSKLVFAPGSKSLPNDVALLEDSEIISLLVSPEQKIVPIVIDIHELFRQVSARLERIPQERKEREIEKAKRREQRKQRKLAESSTRRRIGERAA